MQTIIGIRRLEETLRRSEGNGDNWHMTWAQDNKQYVVLGDGKGWPDIAAYTGQTYHSRVSGLSGDPPDFIFEHLHGYPDLVDVADASKIRYYGVGILATGKFIYHFLSTPSQQADSSAPRFVGSKLIFSPDQGLTWYNQDGSAVRWENGLYQSRENMVFFDEPDEVFSLVTLLQMGRNYEHNRDGYVYGYAPNGNGQATTKQLAMFRVPKDRILDRSAYEFFVSCSGGGSAIWSRDIEKRGVVHTFDQCNWPWTCWHPSVVYNAPLEVFMMVNWSMGNDSDGPSLDKPSYLGFWVADKPWGPWTQVHEETEWMPGGDNQARAYQPQIAPKWIAQDGRSFWLVFSDFQSVDGAYPYYCFNCQKVEIITA